MSNTLAIAAVTSTMRHVLHESLGGAQPGPIGGADVTTYRPAQLSDADTVGNDASGLNVYLYQVTPNHAWNLSDLPTRHGDGSLARRPVAALDLHYLVTAYGDEEALEPQRLLARGTLALASTPVFTKAVIQAAIDKYDTDPTGFLADADLADQAELVKVSPTPLSLEEMSKLWGVLGTPYLLSLAYTATVVLIEADVVPRRALPVRERVVAVRPLTRIRLEAVEVDGGGAVVTGATLVLTGGGLLAAHTAVSVGSVRLVPDATSTTTRLTVTLTADVSAGVHAVQVLRVQPADPVAGTPERVTDRSSGLPVMVLPTPGPVTKTATLVRVPVAPPLREGQRATVTFGRLSGGQPDDPPLVGATFPPVLAADAPLARLDVARNELTAGTWLVRVSVDGAESLPTLSGDTYDGPAVTLP
ncbi:DUF4255 domain-containing protein [Intrasporangium mesophilum]